MIKKMTLFTLSFITALACAVGCGMQPAKFKAQTIVIPGGTVAPALGVGFDVHYDPNLDDIIPGYKILTVAYTNNSMNIIQTDSSEDRWIVENRRGKKIKAITNLRNKDPDTWAGLPKKLKVLIEYPLLIPIGSTQTVDLLFKNKENLSEFKSVLYEPGGGGRKFKILPRVN